MLESCLDELEKIAASKNVRRRLADLARRITRGTAEFTPGEEYVRLRHGARVGGRREAARIAQYPKALQHRLGVQQDVKRLGRVRKVMAREQLEQGLATRDVEQVEQMLQRLRRR